MTPYSRGRCNICHPHILFGGRRTIRFFFEVSIDRGLDLNDKDMQQIELIVQMKLLKI